MINKDTREYLIRKIKTIKSRTKNLNEKTRVSDFASKEDYEKWHRKQIKTITSMKQVLKKTLINLMKWKRKNDIEGNSSR